MYYISTDLKMATTKNKKAYCREGFCVEYTIVFHGFQEGI
jgi:hypothetical protein